MILPKSMLEDIDYYEVKLLNRFPNNKRNKLKTCIIIHWKQWWKIRSKFIFPAITKTTSEDDKNVHFDIYKNANHLSLENQLSNYFKR